MKKCILYGAASIGNIAKQSLENCGIEVLGYIDKRAFELQEYNGLPVWELETIPLEFINAEIFIYVSVKNVFEHEKIALQLKEKGFEKLIYKPYSVLLGYNKEEEYQLAQLYDELFTGNLQEDFSIPRIEPSQSLHDFAFIKEEDEQIIAYIPSEFVFTNDYIAGGMEKWGNVALAAFFTHINFFRFLNNQTDADITDYLEKYCVYTANLQKKIQVTESWKNNVIENRTQIFEQMKDALDLDSNFFIRNAAEAKWNHDKKYFNLLSGKHRCTFQVAMGKKYLPLKIQKKDYDCFFHKNEVKETWELLKNFEKEVIVPHPVFYRGLFSRDKGEYSFLLWFARYYGEKLYHENDKVCFEKLKIIDYTDDYGNFARFCKRMGCYVQRRMSPNRLEKQLNRLFYADGIDYEEKITFIENNIIVIELKKEILENSEIELLLASKNSWIVKYAEPQTMEIFSDKYGLVKKIEINVKYVEGRKLKSYLLEKKEDAK